MYQVQKCSHELEIITNKAIVVPAHCYSPITAWLLALRKKRHET